MNKKYERSKLQFIVLRFENEKVNEKIWTEGKKKYQKAPNTFSLL